MQFEGEHKQIVLRGIERAGQDTMIADGAMNEVIGLDMRDGSYVPYMPTSEDASLPKDTILVRHHHTSVGNNLIAIDKNLSLFFKKENSEAWQYVCQVPSAEIAMLGNAICTTESGFYLLWQDSNYVIKRRMAFPHVSLRAVDISTTFTETDESYTDDTRYLKLAKDCNDAGYLHQMHLCRYAILLADGSYAYISNPFLIPHPMARESYGVIKNNVHASDSGTHAFLTKTTLWCKQLQYKIDGEIDEEEVIGIKIFLTRGYNLYNLNKIYVESDSYHTNTNHPVYDEGIYKSCLSDLQEDDIYYNVYTLYPQDIHTGSWQGISLAGHLGDNLPMGDVLSLQQMETFMAERLFVYNNRLHMMNARKRKSNDIQLSDFYYQQSGSKDYEYMKINYLPEADSDILSITVHRQTQDAEFAIEYVYSHPEAFSGLACRITIHYKDGQSESVYCDDNLMDILKKRDKEVSENLYRITIWYKNIQGSSVVVKKGYVYGSLNFLNPYLSVGSRDATRILLEVKVNDNYYRIDRNLKASETQNVAYYLDTTLQPIRWEEASGFMDGITESESHAKCHLIVSETNFPNIFSNDEYVFDGASRVIDCCQMSLELTNENFGYFPLVVFTDCGIYTLKVSDNGKYAYGQRDKISEEVCTNRDMICRTDKGILFSTKRGLFVLGERSNEALNFLMGEPRHIARHDDLRGHGLDIYYCAVKGSENNYAISDMFDALSIDDVRTLIQEDCYLEYDKNYGRCILWSPKVKYLYVIDLQTLTATKQESKIRLSDKEGGYYESGN